jgi:hypothetical protein
VKKIINRFKKFAENEEKAKNFKSSNSDSENPSEEDDSNEDDVIKNARLKDKTELRLVKMDETLKNSSIKGLAGHETRMLITKTLKDIAFIVFLIYDMPVYFKAIKLITLKDRVFK